MNGGGVTGEGVTRGRFLRETRLGKAQSKGLRVDLRLEGSSGNSKEPLQGRC